MIKQTLLGLSLASMLATQAFAAPTTYEVDGTHTFARFSYNHMGFSQQISSFNKTSGTVTFDPEARTSSVDITIDTRSVNTGYDAFNGHIQGEDFLDTANHPTATFKSTSVRFEGDQPVAVEGALTIKGVTRPVTLELTSFTAKPHPMLQKDAIGANATATIKRSEFNAGKLVPAVSDDVTLLISLEAIAQ